MVNWRRPRREIRIWGVQIRGLRGVSFLCTLSALKFSESLVRFISALTQLIATVVLAGTNPSMKATIALGLLVFVFTIFEGMLENWRV